MEKQERGQAKKDYSVRRKVIWKGKMAPRGHVYICIDVESGKIKVSLAKLIKGNQGQEKEEAILTGMREVVRKKYKI